ncbi:MAG: AtpZ/AtpI family protein [Eubacterium sp.]|nr:AtpZ/AtpI family protein [Eubacterium sp.]
MRKRDKSETNREIMTALALILQIGLAILICMAMSLGIGYYLDKLFGTRFIILIFMVIGFLASIRSMLILTGRYHPGEKSVDKDAPESPDEEDNDL